MHVWPNSIKLFHFEEYSLCKRVSGSVTYQEIRCLHFIRRKKKGIMTARLQKKYTLQAAGRGK